MTIAVAPSKPIVVLRPGRRFVPLNLRDLWDYRELLFFLIWRDVKVRYKQTALGAAWAVLQPFMLMIVFSVFLGHLAKVPSDGVPYPLFAFVGLVPWTFFAQALAGAANSLVLNENLVAKVYFPRLIMPAAVASSFLVDLVIAVGLLAGLMAWYGTAPTLEVLWVPLFALLALGSSLAIGVWLAALNVRYRDVRHALPFLIQLWMFATPVAYAASLVPERWRLVYALNPMAGVVSGFRWSVLGAGDTPGGALAISTGATLVLLLSGLFYFRKVERTFADII